MYKMLFACLGALFLFSLTSEGYLSQARGEERKGQNIRDAILAGTWYPGSQDGLKDVIELYLSRAGVESHKGELKAIIVPHAGYVYSGQVAAYAYGLLQKKDFKRVIMIGPSHRAGFRGVSINLQSGYKTPLGTVPVDLALARKILNSNSDFRTVPQAHAHEHSLEIQLPFLQSVLEDFQIVPILMGEQDYKTCSSLAKSLVQAMNSVDRTLLLASTDLSHFYSYKRARELDLEFIKHVRQFEPQGLARALSSGLCEACGRGPAVSTMLAARELGANRAIILKYANSGDVTGDHSRVVGYLSAALIRDK
jgi:AmmeMemoRadiSam system protein B